MGLPGQRAYGLGFSGAHAKHKGVCTIFVALLAFVALPGFVSYFGYRAPLRALTRSPTGRTSCLVGT